VIKVVRTSFDTEQPEELTKHSDKLGDSANLDNLASQTYQDENVMNKRNSEVFVNNFRVHKIV